MHKTFGIIIFAICLAMSAGVGWGETFHLAGGQTMTGEIISMNDQGIILKNPDGSYGDRTPWTKLSQDDLKGLSQDPKAAQFVQQFILQSTEEKMQRTQVEVKDVPRLSRPAKGLLIKALFTSTMGLFIFLIIYGANLYAAYEIAVFRNRPIGTVCGVSAVAPFIGPIIFLAMPHHMRQKEVALEDSPTIEELIPAAAQEMTQSHAAPAEATAEIQADPVAPPKAATSKLPPAKVFARGQFTFNRRFFETQMPGFFPVVRPEADKDKVLLVKAARGTYQAQRITRISVTDVTLHVQKGIASEDVIVPFGEIQEVQIKHKDA